MSSPPTSTRVHSREAIGVLALAHARALAHHVGRVVGGERRIPWVLGAGVVVTVGVGALTFVTLRLLLGAALRHAHRASLGLEVEAGQIPPEQTLAYVDTVSALTPVFVASLAVASGAIVLLFFVLMPAGSTISLAARQAGVGRWVIGATAYLTDFVWAAAVAVGFQAGAIAFIAWSAAASHVVVAVNSVLIVMVGAASALAIAHAATAVLTRLGLGAELSRVAATLTLSTAVIAGAVDALRAVVGDSSVLGAVLDATTQVLPDSLAFTFALSAAVAILVSTGVASSLADSGADAFGNRASVVRLPPIRHLRLGIMARLSVALLREPNTKLSLVVVAVFGAALAVGVRTRVLDPGVGVLLLAVFIGSGLETLGGFALRMRWQLVASGTPVHRALWMIYVPAASAQVIVFLAFCLLAGIVDSGPRIVSEGASVVICLGAMATLAGVLVPLSPSAREGIALTTVVALVLELSVLLVLTTWLQLTGLALVGASLAIACFAIALTAVALRQRSAASF